MTPSITKKKAQCPHLGPPLWKGSKRDPEITFSRFSREICTFEKNVWSQKIFFIEFSTKMVLIQIFVAVILTKLQRFESRANVKVRGLKY